MGVVQHLFMKPLCGISIFIILFKLLPTPASHPFLDPPHASQVSEELSLTVKMTSLDAFDRVAPPSFVHGVAQDGRLLWLDAAKGVGIILVVLGHVLRGLDNAALIQNQDAFSTVDRDIYLFHMPLFFIISGYLFGAGRQKTLPEFLTRSGLRLLWPMALWTWIFFAFKILAGGAANNVASVEHFPWWPLPPREHFWFLWALFLAQCVAFSVLAWVPAGPRRLQVSIGLFAAACAARLWLGLPTALDAYLGPAIAFLPMFAAGIVFQVSRAEQRFGQLILPLLAIFIVAEIAGTSWNTIDGIVLGAGLAAASAVLFSVYWSVGATDGRAFGWLARLGEASLAIFVAHTIFSAATRIALVKIGVTSLPVHVALGVGAGLIVPFVLYRLAVHYRVTRAVGF